VVAPVLVLLSTAGVALAVASGFANLAMRRRGRPGERRALAAAGGLAGVAVACAALLARGPARDGERTLFAGGVATEPFVFVEGIRRPLPSQQIRAVKPPTGTPVFDVTYTIDSWGNRSAPEAPGRPAVVFFGCSFAFGNGLEDDETLPWQFALDVGRQFDVVNAALSGYGAHHMLRMLEIGLLDGRVPSGVARAFYSAIPDHVRRAAQGQHWDLVGPRYELEGEGLRLAGAMRNLPGRLFVETLQYAIGPKWRPPWEIATPGPADVERWSRIVARSAALVRERWGAPLTVVMWDFGTPWGRRLGAELRRHGLDVVLVSDLLPPAQVRFIPGDGHPTASTDAALARALATRYFPRPGTPD